MTTGDPILDRWLYAASWLFLLGIVMVIASAVPALVRRVPRLLPYGFFVCVGSLALVLVAAIVRG